MSSRRSFLDLPLAPVVEPSLDRRIGFESLAYPWLVQRFPRSPVTEDTAVPEDWPDVGAILDLLDL
jgi:hypothetical protein